METSSNATLFGGSPFELADRWCSKALNRRSGAREQREFPQGFNRNDKDTIRNLRAFSLRSNALKIFQCHMDDRLPGCHLNDIWLPALPSNSRP
jgi:hypothetical protein